MSANLIVPINVRALCTNDRTAPRDRHGPTAEFSDLPSRRVGGQWFADKPFLGSSVESLGSQSVDAGVTLHWALPDALTHGQLDHATQKIVFPVVPNRWLVTRIIARDDAPDSAWTKSWVIESDRVRLDDEGQGCATFPVIDQNADPKGRLQFFRSLGRSSDYNKGGVTWREDPTGVFFADVAKTNATASLSTSQGFTALGYGEPTFAAYAPNCPNVFGFHDRLETSLPSTDDGDREANDVLAHAYTATYVVSGWYSDKSLDPATTLPAGDQANDQHWDFTGAAPARTLYSGTIAGVRWDPAGDYNHKPSDVDIAVGHTSGEALSALLAANAPQVDGAPAEALLNAIQTGLLKRLNGQPGWIAKLEMELHRRGFASEAGDTLWTVIPRDQAKTPADPGEVDISTRSADLPTTLAADLAALNTAQQAYDKAVFSIEAQRRQVHLDWCRYQQLTAEARRSVPAPAEAPKLTTPAISDLLRMSLWRIDQQATETGRLTFAAAAPGGGDPSDVLTASAPGPNLASAAAAAWKTVKDSLGEGLLLKRGMGPRFWRPVDPVVLLRGDDFAVVKRNEPTLASSTPGNLPCRRSDQVVASLKHPSGAVLTPEAIARADGYLALDADIRADLNALHAEAVLLEARFDGHIADLLAAKVAGVSAEALRQDLAALRAGLAGGAVAGSLSTTGVAPCSIARTDGATPTWTPLLLRWTIEHQSVFRTQGPLETTPLPSDLLTAHHTLDNDAVDLSWKSGEAPAPDRWQSHSGFGPLAGNAALDLARELAEAEKYDPDPELAAIVGSLKAAPILAQALGGLHDSFLMLNHGPQLPIVDPLLRRLSDQIAPYALPDAAPDALGGFSPIRSGPARLAALEVIDIFGRALPIDLSRVVWSYALRDGDGAGLLPARIAQAARLQFRWLSAVNDEIEANTHPASTPVCGWVLPNFFDDSLALFGAGGEALGSLALAAHGQEARWVPAVFPGSPQTVQDIANVHLRDFAGAILAQPAGHLDSMLRVIDRAISTIIPPGPPRDPSLSVLLGRPLALTRASLSVEIKGEPAAHMGWLSLQNDALAASTAKTKAQPWSGARDIRDWTAVKIPVRLGDLKQASDGLVGYFPPDGQFRSPAATADMIGVKLSSDHDIALSPRDPALAVTLLVDPFADVNATTGVFPVKSLSLPDSLYAPALGRLNASFYAGPMLFKPNDRQVPVPRIEGFDWSWRRLAPMGAWADNPLGAWPGDVAEIDYDTQRLEEGWLNLAPKPAPSAPIVKKETT